MPSESAFVAEIIDRPPAAVYEFTANPENLPRWAAGLSGSIEQVDGEWIADSPMGKVRVVFEKANDIGVLDHDVTLPDGTTMRNPLRVVASGEGSEIVFSVRRQPGFTDDEFRRDTEAVAEDLATLKRLLEAG